jgi:pSer/pThr/pTyr-binding forkhead associated (FHA) protein
MRPVIEVIDGPLDGLQFCLQGNSDIGKDKRNAISIYHDGTISRFHACVDLEGRDWLLSDTKSSNGTRIDNKKLLPFEKYPLTDNCYFCLGATIIQFYYIPDEKYIPTSDHEKDIRETYFFDNKFQDIWEDFYKNPSQYMDTKALVEKCIYVLLGSKASHYSSVKKAFSRHCYDILGSWIGSFRYSHQPDHQGIISDNLISPRIWRIFEIIKQTTEKPIRVVDFIEALIHEKRSVPGLHFQGDSQFLQALKNPNKTDQSNKIIEETTTPSALEFINADMKFLIQCLLEIEQTIGNYCKKFNDFPLETNFLPHLRYNISKIAFSQDGSLYKDKIQAHIKDLVKVISIILSDKTPPIKNLKGQIMHYLSDNETIYNKIDMLIDEYVQNEESMLHDQIARQLKELNTYQTTTNYHRG